jgi:hypothetical protein
MKTKLTLIKGTAILMLLSTFNPQLSTAFAQGTAFTYQGRLNDGTNPANGSYDLRFTVYDAVTGGSAVGGPLTNTPTAVSNGVFSVVLDFGAVFPGANRWLEIAARTNGGGSFSLLSPRQPLTAAPYAVTAGTVTGVVPGAGLSGTYGGPVNFVNNANTFSGNGSGLIDLNANNLAIGSVPSAALNNAWKTTGNLGTSPTNGNFIGTTDNQPLELKAGGSRVLRLEPDSRGDGAGNLIGGFINNAIEQPGSGGDVIGGGGYISGLNIIHSNSSGVFIGAGSANQIGPNINDSFIGAGYGNTIQSADSTIVGGVSNTIQINAQYSAVGGGYQNSIQSNAQYSAVGGGYQNSIQSNAQYSAVGGGYQNSIQSNASYSAIGGGLHNTINTNSAYGGGTATIGGGFFNTVSAPDATVGGGYINTASGEYATAGGGDFNVASGLGSTVPGGDYNMASGDSSFAAGNNAQALHSGTFVWSDATGVPFASTGPNQFLVSASGGVGINTANPAGAALNVAGTVKATAFQGDGSGLFNLNSGAALGNYVFAYSASTMSVAAANTFQDIPFNTDAQINGWTHTGGTAPYTSAQTGLYLIQYDASASTTLSTGASVSVHATLNLTEIPGSQASVFLSTNSVQLATISRSFIASVNASDVLTLQVAGSSTSSRLTGNGSGSTRPSVSMTITRIQ